MFGESILSTNIPALSALTITFYIVIFYALGRIVQNKFKFSVSYKTLAIPFGFVIFEMITFVLYSTFYLFTSNIDVFYWMEIVRLITISAIVIALINDWRPKRSDFSLKGAILFFSVIGTAIGTFILSYYSNLNIDYMSRWESVLVADPNMGAWQTQLQTYVMEIQVMSEITTLATKDMYLIVSNFINITVITSLLFTLAKYRREITTYFLVPLATVTLLYINGLSELQMTPFMMLIIFDITMMYMYYNSAHKNRLYLYAIVLASGLFSTFMASGIMYSLIFMIPALYVAQKDNASPVYVLNSILIVLATQTSLMIYAESLFGSIVSILIWLIVLVPLNSSILYRQSHSIFEFDKGLVESRRAIAISIVSILLIVSSIMIVTQTDSFVDNINYWYTDYIFQTSNEVFNQTFTLTLYFVMLFMPIMVYVYKGSNTVFTKYINLMVLILFNPITIGAFNGILGNNLGFQNVMIILMITTGITMIDMVNIYLIPKFREYN